MISLTGSMASIQCRTCHQLQTKLLKYEMQYRQRMFISTQTHYEALSLKRTASQRDVKDAFIKYSKLTHPDLHPNNPEKHKKFVRINEAYEVLSSPVKRKEYDNSLSFGARPYPHSGNDPFTYRHQRQYQEYNKNHDGNRGKGFYDEESFHSRGFYDHQTGEHHIYNDASTASMSAKDWQNVLRFARYLASFVILMNTLVVFNYVKQRGEQTKRNSRYINHRQFLSAEEAEKMRIQSDKQRELKKKRKRKKKKEEDPELLSNETAHHKMPAATIT